MEMALSHRGKKILTLLVLYNGRAAIAWGFLTVFISAWLGWQTKVADPTAQREGTPMQRVYSLDDSDF